MTPSDVPPVPSLWRKHAVDRWLVEVSGGFVINRDRGQRIVEPKVKYRDHPLSAETHEIELNTWRRWAKEAVRVDVTSAEEMLARVAHRFSKLEIAKTSAGQAQLRLVKELQQTGTGN